MKKDGKTNIFNKQIVKILREIQIFIYFILNSLTKIYNCA